MFYMLKEGHRYADCPYKNITDLKFCTSCGVGDHSLEDSPTMLDKINKKKNVNVLSCVQKHDVINTKNLHIVTRQGTKIGSDNPRISKIKEKNDYPNPATQKKLYNDATNIFREFARQKEEDDNRQDTVKELIHLVQKDKTVSQFIDLLYKIKQQ